MSRSGSDTLNASFNATFGGDNIDLIEVNCENQTIDLFSEQCTRLQNFVSNFSIFTYPEKMPYT